MRGQPDRIGSHGGDSANAAVTVSRSITMPLASTITASGSIVAP
ncbi:hypothetical protein [Mycolicibacterium mageritense]